MKRIFIVLSVLALTPITSFGARQSITQMSTPTASREVLRTQTNTRLDAIDDNFVEIYDTKSDKTEVIRYWSSWPTTGPNNILAVGTIVAYNGNLYKVTQEVTKTGGTPDPATLTTYFSQVSGGTTELPVATDTILGGIKVGARLTITDGILSADVQTADISGKQDVLVSGTNIKTINSTSLLGSGNIDIAGGSVHDAVTLGTDADVVFGLSTQQITLDSQTANYFFAAPNGSAGDPTFRALVAADIPTLNQNTTGTAAGLTAQYIDWDAPSGGASIANKPTLGTAASLNVGTSANNIVQLNSSGELPFTIDLANITDTANILAGKQAADADLTTYAGITPSASVQSLLGAANYAAMRTLLDLEVGTDFNAYDADLTTWAGVTPGTGVATALGVNAGAVGSFPVIIAEGTSALGTSAISSGACASVVTTSASGVATTDVINWGFNTRISQVTGYGYTTGGALRIDAYPTANNVNFEVCNQTSASITPGAVTINWQVLR